MINKTTIAAVKDQTDIKDLIESYGVSLRRSGRSLMGLCPFHGENSPSFSVSEEYQTYHCFGCGESGDSINFVREMDGYDFSGAVEMLAEKLGIEIVNDRGSDPEYEKKKRYLSAYEWASLFYRKQFAQLPEDHIAKSNLADRGLLLDSEWLERFGIGYAPEGYTNLATYLNSKGYENKELVDFGLLAHNEDRGTYFDKYRHRLMWEIRDVKGKVIGFGGRKLNEEDKAKYLNTQETILYHKSNVLYGLDLSRKAIAKTKTCYVVEGYTDVMAMHAVGIENVVASSGTAFGTEHTTLIRRLIDDYDATKSGDFVFVFDGDKAGIKAAMRVFDIEPSIKERSYVVEMTDGDPCDVRKRDGEEALKAQLLRDKIPLTEFVLKQTMKSYDLSIPERKEEFLQEAFRILSTIKQSTLRSAYAKKVELWTGVTLGGQYSGAVIRPTYQSEDERGDEHRRRPAAKGRELFERKAVSAFLQHPAEVFPVVERYSIDECITNSTYNEILFDAMSLFGAGERLVAEDFRDRDMFIALLAETVDTANIVVFAERQFQVLLRLNAEQKRQDAQEKMAAKYRNEGSLSAEDLRAAFSRPKK